MVLKIAQKRLIDFFIEMGTYFRMVCILNKKNTHFQSGHQKLVPSIKSFVIKGQIWKIHNAL